MKKNCTAIAVLCGQKSFFSTVKEYLRRSTFYLLPFLIAVVCHTGATAQTGSWTALTNVAPHFNSGVMLLLPDGSVICKSSSGGGQGKVFDKLTPSSTGSYAAGTWSSLPAMTDDRLYFSSQVIRDGRVYVAGGEYSSSGGGGGPTAKGEVYSMLTNTWTAVPTYTLTISDANSAMLPSGKILQAAVASTLRKTFIYDPATNTNVAGPSSVGIHNESSWVTLPDNSILFVDRLSTNSERYFPSTNTWVADASLPVGLYDPYGDETGAGFLLPNGKVFFIGSTGSTAIYTPSGTTSPGSWIAGATIPNIPGGTGGQGAPDAAAAMMTNGNILLTVSPVPRPGDHFPDSTVFYEYDYVSNTYTVTTTPYGGTFETVPCYITNMLALPNGQILFAYQGDNQYFVYTPGSGALSAGRPTVTSVSRVNCDTFTAYGTLFNGISEGACYGDDWQMSSNYPIIRLTSGSTVKYTRTYNWNRQGAVMTGSALDTVQFVLPSGTSPGAYTLEVVANGNPSSGFSINTNNTITPSTTTICPTNTTTLTPSWTGGTWSSGNTSIATVGSATGVVTGVATGTAIITYRFSAACFVVATVNVSGLSAIGGSSSVCVGSAITLTNSTSGGTWSSNTPSVGTVGVTSGIVTGIAAGTTTITYSAGGCTATKTVTVAAVPSISAGSTVTICSGTSTAISATGGTTYTWSPATGLSATTGASVTATPTTTTTYTVTGTSSGCSNTASKMVSVNTTPSVSAGSTATICFGNSTGMTATGGTTYTWAPSTGLSATTGASVTATPTTTTTYTVTGTTNGCSGTATKMVSVNALPSVSAGSNVTVCTGNSAVLIGSGASTYSWSPSTGLSATTGSTVTATPSTTTTYSLTGTAASGCSNSSTVTVTVSSVLTVSAGSDVAICSGSSTTLSATGASVYTWSPGSGLSATSGTTVTASPTVTTTYTVLGTSGSCSNTATVTVSVNPLANAGTVTGVDIMCETGAVTMLTSGASGGVWSSSNPAVGSVDASGNVFGISGGTVTISYTVTNGCGPLSATHTTTVLPLPNAGTISGTFVVCAGGTTTLTTSGSGGVWSSTNTAVGTISTGGVVSGLTTGTTTISYSVTSSCGLANTTHVVTVNLLSAGAITGPSSVSAGSTITLSDSVSGGVWTSSNTSVATVGSGTGIVTGAAVGTATISYTRTNSCGTAVATMPITVNVAISTPITGTMTVCVGSTTTLSNATSGGTWSSGSTSIATVSSGGVVTGVAAGNATISYTIAGTSVTAVVTVNATPPAITGATGICAGFSTTLSNTMSGGTWSSSDTSIATIDTNTGLVAGITNGTATITYTSGAGCYRTTQVTVGALNPITGLGNICIGLNDTLSHSISGGVWSSSNPARGTIDPATGILTGISTGPTTVTYSLGGGCYQTKTVFIQNIPLTISGIDVVCQAAVTTFSCTSTGGSGGTWSSADTSIAIINAASGTITGVTSGTVLITYTLVGCYNTRPVTVNPIPTSITGTTAVCVGNISTLTGAPSGGSWTSSNTAKATVGSSSGAVTGVSGGTATITYMLATGCYRTITVTVGTMPAAITGTLALCSGNTTVLSSATAGGTWSSLLTSVATTGTAVSASTTVTGISAGNSTITYTVGGCGQLADVTVNASPAVISGSDSVCVGGTTTLTDATGGGTWSSSATAKATIGSATGLVTGLSAGTTNITYSTGTTCFAIKQLTVSSAPAAITGNTNVCLGLTSTLSHPVTGGTWSSSNTAVATIDATTGVVTGVTTGTSTITYVVSPGCIKTAVVNVAGLPAAIGGGTSPVCEGLGMTLTNTTTGGTWISGTPGVATVGSSTGLVTGVGAGTSTITYKLTTSGCYVTKDVTVNAAPAAITGSPAVCVGSMDTLNSTTSGGTWTSSAAAVAPVGSTGIVTGTTAGAATISYTLSNGCRRTFGITVSNLPAAITGALTLCLGNTITLTSTTASQTWSSSNTTVATIGSATSTTGLVTGLSTGTTTISYTNAGGCARTAVVTVNAALPANTGGNVVCVGQTITLANTTTGGTWVSSTPAKATVNISSGLVTGVATGTTNVTYSLGSGCMSITQVTVNAAPAAISGVTTVCAGQTTALSHATTGGTWSSSNTAKATVNDTTGVVTGVSAGTTTITYAISSGCIKTIVVTVKPSPAAIAGATSVLVGSTTILTDATTGGTWSSSATGTATVGSATGVVTGISGGMATITYYVAASGCFATSPMTVDTVSSRPGSGGTSGNHTPDENLITVSPNPTSGTLIITTAHSGVFTVYTIDGKLISKWAITDAVTNVTLPNNLATGIYMCRFTGDDGSSKMIRLVYQP